jgi:hypothetical protein
MAAPISGEGLDTPAELIGSTADGAISATGSAMQQQMDRPATAALEQGGGDALLGPDEITATSGDDDDRAMGSWPLAQLLFYQYKRTEQRAERLQGNGSTQSKAMR